MNNHEAELFEMLAQAMRTQREATEIVAEIERRLRNCGVSQDDINDRMVHYA